jgi:acylphosphatase
MLGIVGFVRTLPRGEVEVVAEGPEPTLNQLRRYVEQGPVGAQVSSVRADFMEPSGEFTRFEIR